MWGFVSRACVGVYCCSTLRHVVGLFHEQVLAEHLDTVDKRPVRAWVVLSRCTLGGVSRLRMCCVDFGHEVVSFDVCFLLSAHLSAGQPCAFAG